MVSRVQDRCRQQDVIESDTFRPGSSGFVPTEVPYSQAGNATPRSDNTARRGSACAAGSGTSGDWAPRSPPVIGARSTNRMRQSRACVAFRTWSWPSRATGRTTNVCLAKRTLIRRKACPWRVVQVVRSTGAVPGPPQSLFSANPSRRGKGRRHSPQRTCPQDRLAPAG